MRHSIAAGPGRLTDGILYSPSSSSCQIYHFFTVSLGDIIKCLLTIQPDIIHFKLGLDDMDLICLHSKTKFVNVLTVF
jgi:hypothetical protein